MLHIITRTCDKASIQSKRIVNKTECALRCVNSVLKNMENLEDVDYHIIDDRSSEYFRDSLTQICEESKQKVTFDFLGDRDVEGQNPHAQSRFSVKVAYDYIYNLPDEDFVYIVDDDHLHYPDAIKRMLLTWDYLDLLVNVVGPRNTLRKNFKLGRVRILLKEPRSTLSWHRDPEPRLHIPIVTNLGCRMVIENISKHMPADGTVTITNNTKYHNFFNGGEQERIHLVACVLEDPFNNRGN